MRLIIIVILNLYASIACLSQTHLFTADTVWIHKANPDDEDLSSYFPLVTCNVKPAAAESINKTLQMEELGFILNEKGKIQLKHQPEAINERLNLVYTMTYPTNRLLTVDVGHFERTSSMALAGNYIYHRYYFDALTGDPVSTRSFFTEEGFSQLNAKIVPLLRQSFVQTMKKYEEDFTADKEKDLDTDCGCQCTDQIDHSFCSGRGMIDGFSAGDPLTYSINSCQWTNPGNPNDFYRAVIPAAHVKSYLSDYGKYTFTQGPPVMNNFISNNFLDKIWKGTIGDKILITFLIKRTCTPAAIKGLEVYDNYGTCISLQGTYKNQLLIIHELSPEGKTLATIEATLQSGKFSGQWTKSDGSKTLTFAASPLNPF